MALGDEYCHIQLINGDGFLDDSAVDLFVKKLKLAETEPDYSIVSIIGPQSSGKSTLLNHLFGSKFTEMDALKDRSQTTRGIWLTKSITTTHSTLVMDVEGTDGIERGPEDIAFEKQTALFAFAVSDVIVINMWCHDIGRNEAANRPLFRTVMEVMGKLQLFNTSKTTLLFVIRDKTKSPLSILASKLSEDIEKIWDSLAKPDGFEEAPLDKIFDVEIRALPNYETEEDQFKEQVNNLRHEYFDSGKFVGKGRDVLPSSGFAYSAKEIWRVIRENKDLNLPAHKAMVATVRCEEIAKECLELFTTNEDWHRLNEGVLSDMVPHFGSMLGLILHASLSRYDMEAKYFDEGVRTAKREQLKDKILQLADPAFNRMLEHIHSQTFDQFKRSFQERLDNSEYFSTAAIDCITSSMNQYDERCRDVMVEHANWDLSGKKDNFQQVLTSHISVVSSFRVMEIVTLHKEQLEEVLRVDVGKLLVQAGERTWQIIRRICREKKDSAISNIQVAASGLEMDANSYHEIDIQIKERLIRLVKARAKEEASKVQTHMINRFENYFRQDFRADDVTGGTKNANIAALKLLSILAAVRLDDNDSDDEIENTLISAFLSGHENIGLLVSDRWEQVPLEDTLILPRECENIWQQFKTVSDAIVIRTQNEARGENNSSNTSVADTITGIAATAGALAAAPFVAFGSFIGTAIQHTVTSALTPAADFQGGLSMVPFQGGLSMVPRVGGLGSLLEPPNS